MKLAESENNCESDSRSGVARNDECPKCIAASTVLCDDCAADILPSLAQPKLHKLIGSTDYARPTFPAPALARIAERTAKRRPTGQRGIAGLLAAIKGTA